MEHNCIKDAIEKMTKHDDLINPLRFVYGQSEAQLDSKNERYD